MKKQNIETMSCILLVVLTGVFTSSAIGSPGPVFGMEFITIPSGEFMMGSPSSEEERSNDEGPRHLVNINSFELMSTEVTQGMWEEVMGTDIRYQQALVNPGWEIRGEGDNFPMYFVTWSDCQEFVVKLNEIDPEYLYRLPSESEWEYACRAGTTSRFYWGNSDSESTVKQYCWYRQNARNQGGGWTIPHASNEGTQPVGTKPPNSWGLYDMIGNVWEFCEDNWHNSYTGSPTDGSAWISPDGETANIRVSRGGSWFDSAEKCRSASRLVLFRETNGFYFLGFRVARSVIDNSTDSPTS